MAPPDTRKILLFDIGGVCVVSPLAAILAYERAHGIPVGYINFAIAYSSRSPRGAWARLERGEIPLDDQFFAEFRRDIEDRGAWEAWRAQQRARRQHGSSSGESEAKSPVPSVDARTLFWTMMRDSRAPDPFVFPALLRLRSSPSCVLGALSNTVAFPEGVRDERGEVFETRLRHGDGGAGGKEGREVADIRQVFDVFVSSAHVGMRKPERRIFERALEELSGVVGRKVEAREVLFVDDIGSNLKAAREMGFQTLRVVLGESRKAVEELERFTGVTLLDGDLAGGRGQDVKAKI